MHPCILAFTSLYSWILDAACCILYPGFSHLDVGVWPGNRDNTTTGAWYLDSGSTPYAAYAADTSYIIPTGAIWM